MEAVVGLVMLAVIILVLKLVGAWMLSITDVMKKQDTQIKGMVKMNDNLCKIVEELEKANRV